MNDKPPHFSPLESPKASTNSPESRKSQNQTIENHLPVSRPPTSSDPPIVTCESPECVTLAHKLLNYRDVSIDPCENFHRASCGRYYENSLAENSIQEKQVFLQRIVKEFVLNRQPSTSKSENTIKLLFEKCRHITAWDAPEETEIAYKEIMKDIEKLGWSLLDSKWNSSKFDLNDVLSKIAKIGVLDFGIFQFYPVLNHLIIAPSSRGVTEMSGIEKMINTFLDVNDLDVDENMISNHGKEIYEFDVKLKKLQFLDYPETITYSDLKSNISIVDFDGIIQSLFRSGRKEKLWPIVEKRVESYAQPLFAGDVENVIRNATEIDAS
ncbi:hypothetical protein GCK72_006921 [Caenorhabditis remanei]|uniref:Peptidase M13 N-terminal domain-containing protein n=1 Tax=Caenorhabditis remanei TaxID=31234 RepID=A0A6A5HKQ1_CAERE|nr:hypothetical protein GCK72_006921 [Caenorhabditis remanei]KAF1766963.1 hypothetical protein GCK72_006921 [Caenorhabditis remanei]